MVLLLLAVYIAVRRIRITFVSNASLWLSGLFEVLGMVCLFISLDLLSPVTFGFISHFSVICGVLEAVVF